MDEGSQSSVIPPRRPDTLFSMARRFWRLWGFLIFTLVVIAAFHEILLPFVFAFLITYLLAPLVARLQPRMGRVLAVILCYVVILGLLAGFFGLLLPAVIADMAKLRDTLPATIAELNEVYLPRAAAWVEATFGGLLPKDAPIVREPTTDVIMHPMGDGAWRIDLEGIRVQARQGEDGAWMVGLPSNTAPAKVDFARELRELVASRTDDVTSFIGPAVQRLVKGVVGFITAFVITFMVGGFALVDLARVVRFVRSLIPLEFRHGFDELWRAMDKGLGGVVRGQLIICLVNGVLTFIGLIIFGIKYSFLLGVMAGMFSLIPIFGTILSSAPILVIALVSGESGIEIGPAFGILLWIIGIHLLEANVLNPKIIGDSAEIHPVIVVFALIAGEHVFGLVGALLAIPVTSIVQTMYLQVRRHSPVFQDDPLGGP